MNTSMKNKVQLIGNLGGDPELKGLSNGQHMLRLSLATNERFKGADGVYRPRKPKVEAEPVSTGPLFRT